MRGQDALAPRENARSEGVPPSTGTLWSEGVPPSIGILRSEGVPPSIGTLRSEGVPPSNGQLENAFRQDFGKLFHDWAAAKFPIQSML